MQDHITAGNLLQAYVVTDKSAYNLLSELRRSFERMRENGFDGGKDAYVAMR